MNLLLSFESGREKVGRKWGEGRRLKVAGYRGRGAGSQVRGARCREQGEGSRLRLVTCSL